MVSGPCTSLIDKFTQFVKDANKVMKSSGVKTFLKYTEIALYVALVISAFVVNPPTMAIATAESFSIGGMLALIIVAGKPVYDRFYSLLQKFAKTILLY
jgi:hypothetical protein